MANLTTGGARRTAAPSFEFQTPDFRSPENSPMLTTRTQGATQAASTAGGSGGEGNERGTVQGSPGAMRNVQNLTGALAMATRDPGLADAARALGIASNLQSVSSAVSAGNYSQALAGLAGLAGAPGAVVGALRGYNADGVQGAAIGATIGAVYAAAPQLAAVDAVLGLLGIPTLAQTAMNAGKPSQYGIAPSKPSGGAYAPGNTGYGLADGYSGPGAGGPGLQAGTGAPGLSAGGGGYGLGGSSAGTGNTRGSFGGLGEN